MKVLIADIDNTLFDWVGMWDAAFDAAVAELEPRSSGGREQLLDAIRALHQEARNSERGFIALDGKPLGVPNEVAARAGEAFEHTTLAKMVPFDGVVDGLRELRSRGVRVVLHSDSAPILVKERIAALGFADLVERTFATDQATTVHRRSLFGSEISLDLVPYRKPEAAALRYVLDSMKVSPDDAVYLGDSKTHDIPMARSAGVSAIFAEYGCRRHSPGYSKLRRVTHWTNEDVARELLYMQQDADRTVRSFEEVVAMF